MVVSFCSLLCPSMESCTSSSLISMPPKLATVASICSGRLTPTPWPPRRISLTAAVERLLFSADADNFQRDRRVGLFQRGDGELIPAGERHVGDDADFFLPRRLVEQLISFAQRGREIGCAVGDFNAGNFFLQHIFLIFQAKAFLAADAGWNHRGAVAVVQMPL